MSLWGAALVGSVLALTTAASASGLIAWSGPVDRPRDRGAHQAPTPTAGGLGIIAGTCVGVLVFACLATKPLEDLGQIAAALGMAAALGLVGALDDLYDIGAKLKLLVQAALSLAFAVFVTRVEAIPVSATESLSLGPIVGILGTALWLVVVTNAVNFMDGANGLAAGAVAIVLLALGSAGFSGGAPALGAAALVAAVAGVGFLPWNFPKARLFQGDAGALFSSFLLGALAVIGAHASGRGPVFVLFAPLALLPFLADVLLTLLSRARARKPLLNAHSEHLYQRWLAHHGGSHSGLAWRVYGLMAIFAGAGLVLARVGAAVQILGFVGATAAMAGTWILLRRQIAAPSLPSAPRP